MIRLCNLSDIPENGKKLISVDGKEILVIQTGGWIAAVSSTCPHAGGKLCADYVAGVQKAWRTCPHAGGKLCQGRVEDGTITCMEHGVCFDLNDGSIRLDPIDEDLLETIDPQNLPFGPLKIYDTAIEDGALYLKA